MIFVQFANVIHRNKIQKEHYLIGVLTIGCFHSLVLCRFFYSFQYQRFVVNVCIAQLANSTQRLLFGTNLQQSQIKKKRAIVTSNERTVCREKISCEYKERKKVNTKTVRKSKTNISHILDKIKLSSALCIYIRILSGHTIDRPMHPLLCCWMMHITPNPR